MRFNRGGNNPKRSIIGALSVAKFNGTLFEKTELFTTWLECGEDWGEVELQETVSRLLERTGLESPLLLLRLLLYLAAVAPTVCCCLLPA